MKRQLLIYILFLSSFGGFFCNAQNTLFNPDGLVHVSTGGLLHVNGNITTEGSVAQTTNNGIIETANDLVMGDFSFFNSSTINGDGDYFIEGNWINSAVFDQGLSEVIFYASNNEQFIKGSNETRFHNLTLTGNGTGANRKKTLTLNAYVDALNGGGVFKINDRIFDTDVYTLYIENESPSAITNTATYGNEGFVMSWDNGRLSRQMNSNQPYFFPLGSDTSLPTMVTRYRPLYLTPPNTNANTFACRLVNYGANIDTPLDTTKIDTNNTCKANPDYYHLIDHTIGSDAADIDITYDFSQDGDWNNIGQWNTPANNIWNNLGVVVNTPPSPNYGRVKKITWNDFSQNTFILLREIPVAPGIICIDSICPWTKNNQFIATGIGPDFQWNFPNGVVNNNQGNDTTLVDWTDTTGMVSVYQIVANGCRSFPQTCTVNIAPTPLAGFDTLSKGLFLNDYLFSDTSVGTNLVAWYWQLGDGDTSTYQNPQHHYEAPGTYTVTQIVTNNKGCKDTIQGIVIVNEGLVIPNVFTPNSDGINDEFFIPNSGAKEYFIEIYDRWGLKVFESNATEIRWDGRSLSGITLSDGTYYYNLRVILYSGKDYTLPGFLSLLSAKK